jgi:hypothetical protein
MTTLLNQKTIHLQDINAGDTVRFYIPPHLFPSMSFVPGVDGALEIRFKERADNVQALLLRKDQAIVFGTSVFEGVEK